ncbi:MAG TPA: wax ester/triacylglycerol synthase domain-containing protein [Candidatus Dormibacteraeota bacterium]|nr:wax ester/triacylglycerol synthase domain-containing protein [Candidatus Dormibacteraeota bacterium]
MKLLRRLTLADLANLAAEAADTPMHQGALGILEGPSLLDEDGRVRIEAVRTHVAARLDRVPELRRILFQTGPLQGRPLWVDDPEFAIENHVLVARLPEPGGESRALRFAEGMMASLMDRSLPMWQMWFLEGYGAGKVGLFLKLHHVFADGQGILKIVSLLFDLEPGVVELVRSPWIAAQPPLPRTLAIDNLARKGRLLTQAGLRLAHPVSLARSTGITLRAIWATVQEARGAPRTSLNVPVGPTRRVGTMTLPLADVRELAHAESVKVNDVFMDLIAGGLREVLMERGARVEGVRIRASMAVAQKAPREPERVGNHVGTMIVPLPIDIDDARARLAVIAAATAHAKSRQQSAVPQTFMATLALTGLTRLFTRHQHLVNVLVTNLVGPQFTLYVAGARLESVVPIPPIAGNVTAAFAAFSYDGHLTLSVHADGDAWPDLEALMHGMERTWLRLTGARPAVPAEEGLSALSA